MADQTTHTLMMIRPVAFGKNEETAVNNYYQKSLGDDEATLQRRAVKEFDDFVDKLRSEGIEVWVVDDTQEPHTPDSIFPNNWISFHQDGKVWLYPMFAKNRRLERREDILNEIKEKFDVSSIGTFVDWEDQGKYLEGTGSLILDRENKLAYAAISERTHPDVLKDFEEKTGFKVVDFQSYQTANGQRLPIYHTNVMMFVGDRVALICSDSIDDTSERKKVLESLASTGKEIVEITEDQTNQFAGNMLQVKNRKGDSFIIMSTQAYESLRTDQINTLSKYGKIIHSNLETIETLGGGSARCMMAEVFLSTKK